MKALCIGHATYDFTMSMKDYPKENVKYRVEEFTGMAVEKINIYVEGVRVID